MRHIIQSRWPVAVQAALAIGLAAASCAAQTFTPPPTLSSIPPHPVAPDSYEARLVATLPSYHPDEAVEGSIAIYGHGNKKLPWMKHLVDLWRDGFRKFHPKITFRYEMHGTSSGVPSLFTGIGDIAILGEEILPDEIAAFQRVRHYAPTTFDIATGSLDIRNFDYAQMVFVHKDNPVDRLTLVDLDAIYGAEHRRGPRNIRTWGDLGWSREADRTIAPYGWAISDSFGAFVQQSVLLGSHRWTCALREFVHIERADGAIYDHGQQILDALAKDRYGIALSNIRYAGPKVKAVALGRTAAGPFVQATKQTLIDATYPLARRIPVVLDRPPGQKIPSKVREFVRFLLSREGQAIINEDGRYLPLDPSRIAAELKELG